MKLSAIILTLGEYDLAKQCMTTLRENMDIKDDWEVILASQNHDNSKDSMFNKCRIIKIDGNVGYSRGNNIAVKEADGEYIVILNDDFVFKQKMFSKLFELYDKYDKIGNVSPVLFDHLHNRLWSYSILDHETGEPALKGGIGGFAELEYGEYCPPFLIPKKIYEEVGGFDERYYPFNYEDVDFNVKLRINDYKIMVRGDCVLDHIGSQTVLKVWKGQLTKYHTENKQRFKDKWGTFNI